MISNPLYFIYLIGLGWMVLLPKLLIYLAVAQASEINEKIIKRGICLSFLKTKLNGYSC